MLQSIRGLIYATIRRQVEYTYQLTCFVRYMDNVLGMSVGTGLEILHGILIILDINSYCVWSTWFMPDVSWVLSSLAGGMLVQVYLYYRSSEGSQVLLYLVHR